MGRRGSDEGNAQYDSAERICVTVAPAHFLGLRV